MPAQAWDDHMPNQFPESVEVALKLAASTLGESLLELDYPNGSKDAVFAEANILVYVGHGLMSSQRPFRCYAEASHEMSKRIDMVATDGITALAIEAKNFGNIESGSKAVLADVQRLRSFTPQLARPSGGEAPRTWWEDAVNHWGLILVGSHAGDSVTEAWNAKSSEDARKSLAKRFTEPGRRNPSIVRRESEAMYSALTELGALPGITKGAFPICPGKRWVECQDAYLLWAAFRLR